MRAPEFCWAVCRRVTNKAESGFGKTSEGLYKAIEQPRVCAACGHRVRDKHYLTLFENLQPRLCPAALATGSSSRMR